MTDGVPERLTGSIAVIGSAVTDMIVYCGRLPGNGETVFGSEYAQGFGGKGANQAVMAARLGARVTFLGRVGDDEMGSLTVANLMSYGIDTDWLLPTSGEASGVASIWIDASGNNRIVIVPGVNDRVVSADVVEAFAAMQPPNVVLAQLETPQPTAIAAFTATASLGAITVLNPAPAAEIDEKLLALANWLVPNETEFYELWGNPPETSAIEEAARTWGCNIVVTMGADGAVVVNADTTTEVTVWPVKVVDKAGAGDAFLGAFAAALATNLPPETAAELGCAAGSLSVAGKGTQSSYPESAAVMKGLHNHCEPSTQRASRDNQAHDSSEGEVTN